jgi:hypothetical protein
MTVFHDRRTASYHELTGDRNVPGWLNKTYSGGKLPIRPDSQEQYPLDQTDSVVNMR